MMPQAARADDAACIAASEEEAMLQKAAKLHDALKQAAMCAAPSCPADVKTECAQRIVKMNAAMPTLVLAAADENGNDLAAVHVSLDGVALVDTLDGRALAIDPGSHVLRFEAAGKPPVERTIILRESEKDRHLAVVLGTPVAAPVLPPPSGAPPRASTWSTQKTLAIAAGGLGLVGLGVGIGTGVTALSDWSTAKSECSASSCPSASRANAETSRSSSISAGTISTVAFIVGAAGLAGGTVLWFTAPRGESPNGTPSPLARLRFEPLVSPYGLGMNVGGSFQ